MNSLLRTYTENFTRTQNDSSFTADNLRLSSPPPIIHGLSDRDAQFITSPNIVPFKLKTKKKKLQHICENSPTYLSN